MVDSKDIKVMLGVPTSEYARRADFYDYLGQLIHPPGTVDCKMHGQSPARNRNKIIEQALAHDCTHIFFIDDDVLLPPDALMKLLEHDLDMVTGVYLMRSYPHQPIIFDVHAEPDFKWTELTPGKEGLIPIASGGLGCCLIKIGVFQSMEQPWIRLGELKSEADHWCDDVGFFNRAKNQGFKLFCDLSVKCGHIASMVLRPVYQDETWYTSYDTAGTGTALIPQFFTVDDKEQLELSLSEK